MGIDLDLSALPVAHCRFPAAFDEADVEDFFRRYRAFLERGERFVAVFDFTACTLKSTPRLRKVASTFIEEANARPRQLSASVVIVAPSDIWRGAVTAVLWVAKPRAPTHVVASTQEALELARFVADEALL